MFSLLLKRALSGVKPHLKVYALPGSKGDYAGIRLFGAAIEGVL